MELVLVPFELRPEMPEEGYAMSELQASGHDSEHIEHHLFDIAAREGFEMTIPPFLPKTHKAFVLGEMARDRGPEAHMAMHHALFGAYFADGADIGTPDVLLEIARAEGLDPADVVRAWTEGTFDERLHQFRHVALHMGIASTPAALICNELLIGSRPYQNIQASLDRCLVTPENLEERAAES